MARGGKCNGRRKGRSVNGGASDESDEDYTVDEEADDESEDGFVGDESEESFGGEYEDEVVEVSKTKKVKRAIRSRAPPRRKRNGTLVKSRKRKRVSYREDDDEDDDEEFRPDFLDEEEKFPVRKGMKNSSTPRLRKGTVKDDDYEEDEDLAESNSDGFDEEAEFQVVKGTRSSSRPRLLKGAAKDDDEDDDEEEDEEFAPDGLDEEEDLPVKKAMKKPSKSRFCTSNAKDDEEEDEEFIPDGLDEEEDLPVKKEMKNSSKSQLRKGTAKDDVEEDDDEEDGDFTPYGLDEEEDFPVKKGMKNSNKSRLRRSTAKDNDKEDGEFTLDSLDEEEDLPVKKGMRNSSNSRLCKGTSKDDDEEDGDEEDEEFAPDALDEEEDFPVKKGKKNSSKFRLCKGTTKDEEDDEFIPDDLDEEEDFPAKKGMNNSSNSRLRKGTAKDDDDEEDDEEFTPDGLDEEEEFSLMEGVDYSDMPRLRRKGTTKEQKRNRNRRDLMKITRKKSQKKRQLKRKAGSEKEEEFIDIHPVVEEKNKNIAGQRRKRKRLSVDSDSDFVASSGPSDHEFTISEEEREQVREASKFCRGLVTACRGSASLKNSPNEEAPRPQRKFPGRKDKMKVEELKTEAGKQICGICLSEEGKRTVRGTLNCCSHYFCFACIMEWSKVESRCPLCKQRFITISKPARSNTGFDLRTAVIQVPERDQVYQPSEDELRGYLDPYENVLCTECHQGGDDALMLLCDLCDSPAHTYCVGLGREVPEGNWYCESCRPTALVSSNQQNLNPTPDNRTNSNYSVGSPPTPVLTFDLNEMYVPDTPMAEESGDFQSPRNSQTASAFSGIGAFTVFDRRRIQRQIHQLLNNRRRQLGNNIAGAFGAVSGNSLFGSQIARSRESATQPVAAQRVPYHNAHLSHNHRVAVPERSSDFSGQLNLNGASTSSQSFFGEFLASELQGTDASMSLGFVHQQLQPCSSRSYMGPDTSPSPCPYRESTVPSRRTLPSTLRRPL